MEAEQSAVTTQDEQADRGEQVGGPFESEAAAAETVRILTAETDADHEYTYRSPHDNLPDGDREIPEGIKRRRQRERLAGNTSL